MILLRKTLGDIRGSIDLWYDDDGDDRPGEGSAESSEIADGDFPALALDIPPGVSGIDNSLTIVEYEQTIVESDQDVGDVLPDQPRRATREDESASDIPGERADDTTEERDTNLEGDGRASSGLSPEQVEAAEKEFGDLIRGVRLVYSWSTVPGTKRSLVSGHGSQRAEPGSSLPSGRPPAASSRKSAPIS